MLYSAYRALRRFIYMYKKQGPVVLANFNSPENE